MSPKEHQDQNEPNVENDPLAKGRSFVEKLRGEPKEEEPEIDPREFAAKSKGSFEAALKFPNANYTGPSK